MLECIVYVCIVYVCLVRMMKLEYPLYFITHPLKYRENHWVSAITI